MIDGMSRTGFLLRVVLSLSLVLNGIGGSVAAVSMALASPANASATTDKVVSATHSGCHEHASMHQHQQPAPEGAPAGKMPAGHSDCCGTGLCGCACAQLSSLAALEFLVVPPNLEHERLSSPDYSPMAPPALGHLIRPPIA